MIPNPSTQDQLATLFAHQGYLLMPDPLRRKAEGQAYKKGYEIRLVANNQGDLNIIRDLLRDSGFNTANPYFKRNGWVQPIYGREAVERFCVLCGYYSEA